MYRVCLIIGLISASSAIAAKDIPYGIAKTPWPRNLGNHRARIQVTEECEAVWVHIPWRRRDPSPKNKDIIVLDATSGERVKNLLRIEINREFGDIIFQPVTAPGEYYVYYMPYSENKVNWRYSTEYAAPQSTADPAWLKRNGLTPDDLRNGKWQSLPKAKVLEFQTWNAFHRFDPMEVIATAQETKELVAKHAEHSYLLFPEDRKYPIRMTDDLPLRWIRSGPRNEFHGTAQRGEFYVFQIGVYAARKPIEGLAVEISDLRPQQGRPIPASEFHAFNLRGTDWLGRPMKKTITIGQGKVQALWFGVQIPQDADPGTYRGTITIRPKVAEESTVKLLLTISPEVLEDGGVSELWRMARLKWLDSTIGLDDEVVAPYTPLDVEGETIRCLGRSVSFGKTGLPDSIRSNGREILAGSMSMVVEMAGKRVDWSGGDVKLRKIAPGAAVCESKNRGGPFTMTCRAKMEFDGYANFRITLKAKADADVEDIRLEIPFRRDLATYMMGLGRKGGYRPKEWKWVWDINRANNMVWIGDVDAGLHCKLKGPKDTWDLYNLRAGGIPKSWGNNGKGGCTVTEDGDTVVMRAYSGPRNIKAGEEIEFRFGLLITPVKPLDPAHWNQRYYHYYARVVPVKTVAATGASIINCHQGNELNPYINYPFLTTDKLAAYVKEAHAKGIKVKIYYTVRELSNYVAEMWALRSLGFEVFLNGGGGGHSWLREHLVSHYASAWHQPYPNGEVDAAIATTGLSRWHNYYLEGLNWLVKNVGIDGLYLDGIGYDREIMKRVRKVLDRARPGCLIDFHSGNEFTFGGLRVSPACKYMEHFPYINSLWFGEGYDYNETPDYWLVEISGIPFGLYGEMLQGGGNPWRGMIYGMTNRLGWGGDPRAIWKLWDGFGIQDANMIGYWDKSCPVKTSDKDILATAYVKKGKTLLSLASWAKEPTRCQLTINWKLLGLDPKKANLFAPTISGFQGTALFRPYDDIPLLPGRGWLLIIDEERHEIPVPVDVYANRQVLLEESFAGNRLDESWKIALSKRPNTTLKVENGAIVIRAAANCFAFAERTLPPRTTLVECRVCSATDKGATWGPGLALVWKNGILRINLRPTEGRYGVYAGQNYWFGGFAAPNAWHRLRIRLESKEILLEGSMEGMPWETIHTIPRSQFPDEPQAVRLGKMGMGAGNEDYSVLGPPGRCSIKDLQVFGEKK